MPSPDNTTAIIVTRGDQPRDQIYDRLDNDTGFSEIIVWDNGNATGTPFVTVHGEDTWGERVPDVGVYGRYEAIKYATNEWIYVQDDDCLIDAAKLLRVATTYDGSQIVANMPASRWPDYTDSCLVGWGAVFRRELPGQAFMRWHDHFPHQVHGLALDHIDRCCDVIFTTLTPHVKADIGFQHLPWAELPYRMFRQPRHGEERDQVLKLAREVRDASGGRSW